MKSCLVSLFRSVRAESSTTLVDYRTIPVSELIRGCVEGEEAAWQDFIRRFNQIIAITSYRAARRWGYNSPTVVDDLTQETYLKLCADRARVLREFDSSHPDAIFAFLKVIAANVAHDHFRRLQAGKRGGNRVNISPEDAERTGNAANPASPASMERGVLLKEVDACLCALNPARIQQRDRMIFWLYYKRGLTTKEIAGLPFINLSVKGVESTLHRLVQLLRSQLASDGA
jgi:RNA polymerase sigma factor (sigma-70 family)